MQGNAGISSRAPVKSTEASCKPCALGGDNNTAFQGLRGRDSGSMETNVNGFALSVKTRLIVPSWASTCLSFGLIPPEVVSLSLRVGCDGVNSTGLCSELCTQVRAAHSER